MRFFYPGFFCFFFFFSISWGHTLYHPSYTYIPIYPCICPGQHIELIYALSETGWENFDQKTKRTYTTHYRHTKGVNVCRRWVEVKCKNKLARKDAPLLVLLFYRLNISVPTSSVIGVLLQILSASYYDDASTSHGQPSQPSQPLSVSRVLLPFPLLGSPPPLNRCVLGWGWYLPFPSMQLMMTLLVHHRCCLLHAHNMHNYRLCACYWFQSVQFHPALGSGIAIQREFQYLYANECMHHSSPLLCTLAIHFRCCFNFLFVVFFSLAAAFNMLYT